MMQKNNIILAIFLMIIFGSSQSFSQNFAPKNVLKQNEPRQNEPRQNDPKQNNPIQNTQGQNEPIKNEQGQNDDQKLTVDKIDQNNFSGTAVLQGLDKVNAKTSELRIPIGGQTQFGKLTIKAKKCWRAPSDQRPENKVLLEVEENNNDGTKKTIFYGWMFSSSPSISGLEHSIYDITVIECK